MKIKKVVDERQELELLKIEHIVFWIVFWGLFASIVVQAWFMDAPFEQYLAESTVFLLCCIGVLIGCVKKGQWGYYTHPTPKTYAVTAAIGALVFGTLMGVSLYLRYDGWNDQPLLLVMVTAVMTVFMFAAIFGVSALVGRMVRKKRERLEKEYGDEGQE